MEVVKLPAEGGDAGVVEYASRVLAQGGLVAFPTETVYGLGANAANRQVMARLREVKQRSVHKPFTVMIGRRDLVTRYVGQLSPMAARLTRKGWPGPLTVVFELDGDGPTPMQAELPTDLHDGIYYENTIGLRCPDLPFACDMLNNVADPVAVSSANPAGKPAPTDADGVVRGLDRLIDLVIDGGEVRYRKPSTIVRIARDRFEILRPGVLDERAVGRLASWTVMFVCTGNTCRSPMAEGIFRKLLAEKLGCGHDEMAARGIHVTSAGVGAYGGARPTEQAIAVCRNRGVDISEQRSRALSVESINAADIILCMTESHRQSVIDLVPSAADKTCCLDPAGPIEDPAGASADQYETTAAHIEALLREKLKELQI